MSIDELIALLMAIREKEGNIPVKWESIAHLYDPDPVVRERHERRVVILNS